MSDRRGGDSRSSEEVRLPVASRIVHDAVLHLVNEQPLLCDLLAIPSASDSAVLCTNLRLKGGKAPVFVDSTESLFLFPFGQIRFLEIPPEATAWSRPDAPGSVAGPAPLPREEDLEVDEGLLRRIREV